jgi:hypothetical protein
VDGVGWGDAYKFKTTGNGPVTANSAWDYTESNVVPYALEWSNSIDAEMGLVQTQTWTEHLAGGDYGSGVLGASCWKKTSATMGPGCNKAGWTMPADYLWPYQLDQYELPFETHSHRVAWGASYGAVGKATYNAFGKTLSGYPYNSYSVYVVFGTHSSNAVDTQATAVERRAAATAHAVRGQLATSGPGGAGRSDSVAYDVPGYSPIYDTWDLSADGGAAGTIELTAPSPGLNAPMVRILGWTTGAPPAHVQLDGAELTADTDYFATVDTAGKTLWITLNRTITGTVRLAAF